MLSRAVVILLTLIAFSGAGCAAREELSANPIDIAPDDYDYIYRASEQILEEAGLTLDRQDHRFGLVTTRPEPLGTVLEPWRGEHQTLNDALRSTAHDERRVTSIVIEKDRPGGPRARVESVIERVQLPTRYLTGSTRGHQMFASLSSTPTEYRRRGIEPAYWLVVGRDEVFERQLMTRIVNRAQALKIADIPPDLTLPPPLEGLAPRPRGQESAP